MESRKRVSYNRKQKEESGMSVIRKWVSAATATDKARRKQTSAIAVAADTHFLMTDIPDSSFCFLL